MNGPLNQYFNKRVHIICTDGDECQGTVIGHTPELDSENGEESIIVSSCFGNAYTELNSSEIQAIKEQE